VLDSLDTARPLRGVVHLAMVLDDGVRSEQSAERFARVELQTKAEAGALQCRDCGLAQLDDRLVLPQHDQSLPSCGPCALGRGELVPAPAHGGEPRTVLGGGEPRLEVIQEALELHNQIVCPWQLGVPNVKAEPVTLYCTL